MYEPMTNDEIIAGLLEFTCTLCGSQFARSPSQIVHHKYKCRPCLAAEASRRQAAKRAAGIPPTPKKRRAGWTEAYLARPDVKDRYAELSRLYRRDPAKRQKHLARWTAAHAVESGVLVRGPCEICGDPNTENHHDDYSRPLEVRWLCRTHHLRFHRDQRRSAKGIKETL